MFEGWFKRPDALDKVSQVEPSQEPSRPQGAVEESIYRGVPSERGFDATPLTEQAERESQERGSVYALPNAPHARGLGEQVEPVTAETYGNTVAEDTTDAQQELLDRIKATQASHPESFEKPPVDPEELNK